MSEQHSLPISTHPDGGAELHVVLHLRWEDVAALGREAARLAAQLQRPVSLDEAASQRLSARRTATTTATKDRTDTTTASSRMSLASSASTEPAGQWSSGSATSAVGTTASTTRGPFDPPAKIASLPGATVDPGRATG
ncbi:hypothetical protein [Streptomyces sp. RPT161]|uniref:hypothetical protein n=1 Tax=Streptomyces sp. RPT161 TaxID=3015993 RepID=UPI0022B8D2F5|nr:hypothetical protein [Streptomyces sp. RPT161]